MSTRSAAPQPVRTEEAESPHGTAGTVVAQRLWSQATRRVLTPAARAAAAERLGVQVRTGLIRWIGLAGYDVLLSRSLHVMRVAHPTIASINGFAVHAAPPVDAETPPVSDALDRAVVALLATMVDRLGLMVGPEMAGDLLALCCAGEGEADRPISRGTDD